jgi:hypothetical protein
MQDRYVGDAGDFAKYGLLRHLAGVCDRMSELSLGIIWYLVDDESHNRDGRHLAYLRAPALRDCDPDLRVILKQLLETGERSVSVIEHGGVLAKGTRFFSERLPSNKPMVRAERIANRREWFKRALASTDVCDLIFLDPDNGLETASLLPGSSKSHKYVLIEEVKLLLERGQSVLVYQHMHRKGSHNSQIAETLVRLRKSFPGVSSLAAAAFRRGSARAFFLLTSSAHDASLRKRLADLNGTGWGFELGIMYEAPGS